MVVSQPQVSAYILPAPL